MDMSAFTMDMMNDVQKMEFSHAQWIDELPIKKHETLKEIMYENQKHIMADNTIRKYAQLVDEYAELEAEQIIRLMTI
jgi:hypothetical protein